VTVKYVAELKTWNNVVGTRVGERTAREAGYKGKRDLVGYGREFGGILN
jgi:hypothetical protein